jgi:hypothetical protein
VAGKVLLDERAGRARRTVAAKARDRVGHDLTLARSQSQSTPQQLPDSDVLGAVAKAALRPRSGFTKNNNKKLTYVNFYENILQDKSTHVVFTFPNSTS